MADYQIVIGDDGKVLNVDSSQGASVIILPAPTSAFKITVKDIGGMAAINRINVLRNGNETIDGVAADSIIDENNAAVSFISDGTNWIRFDSLHRNAISTSGRAVFTGADTSIVMDYFNLGTLGTATTFGNLTVNRQSSSGTSSSTRGLFNGGASPADSAVIDYITIATTGNATAFGNLTTARLYCGTGSSQTRSICAGTYKASAANNVIDYTTIATTGDAISFGTLGTSLQLGGAGSCCSSVRAVFGGGYNGSPSAVMQYVTITTLGNSTSFGNLTVARFNPGCLSNSTRGIFGGGYAGSPSLILDYIAIATAANAVSFGNLLVLTRYVAGTASAIRGLWATGQNSGGTSVANAEYTTLSTLSNALNFGNASFARSGSGSLSSCHGGLNV